MKKVGKPTRQGKSWGDDDDEEEVEQEVREPKIWEQAMGCVICSFMMRRATKDILEM